MKIVLLTLKLFLILPFASAQGYLDSLQRQLHNAKEDTAKVLALGALADYWGFNQFDSSIVYARQTLDLSQKINYPYGKYLSYYSLFHAWNCKGDYPKALEAGLNIAHMVNQLKQERPWVLPVPDYFLGLLNREIGDYPTAINQFRQCLQIQQTIGEDVAEMDFAYSQLALIYAKLKKLDSALVYAQQGYNALNKSLRRYGKYTSLAISVLGNIYELRSDHTLAEKYFKDAIQVSDAYNNLYLKARSYNFLAELFNRIGKEDSSIYYAKLSLQLCSEHDFAEFAKDASLILSQGYESKHQPDSSFKYLKLMEAAKDSVFSQSKGQQYQQYIFKEQQRQQEVDAAKERYQNRVRMFSLLAALGVFLMLAFILYRSNQQKQKDKLRIENAYTELKVTQAQLIQREKMASLGELTSGIAHEIQNPLNFVNNFSEVNTELIEELKQENLAGKSDEVETIANEIEQNLQKVVHHGKRADAIVKAMLQHSRTNTGQKLPTDLNALTEEYLRLAYHGFRARDKAFNAALQTSFDGRIGKVSIVPQEIGRVLLNLFNNAFYAAHEKMKKLGNDYEPTVTVSTEKLKDKIEIRVRDNGMGISKSLQEKIFQPFFTTKPTGEGTGLGLSLSYDIIKAYGGEIKLEAEEGSFAEFTICLPVSAIS